MERDRIGNANYIKTIDTSLKIASPRGSHDYKGVLTIHDNTFKASAFLDCYRDYNI